MYRSPICDACGEPIDWDTEPKADPTRVTRIQLFNVDGAVLGLDLHVACAHRVGEAWRRFVRQAVADPGRPSRIPYTPS